MSIYLIIGIGLILLLLFFFISFNATTKLKHPLQMMSNITSASFFFVSFIGVLIAYFKAKEEKKKEEQSLYVDKVLENLDEIDQYLINNYDDLSIIFDILYSKIQIPSSDRDLNKLFARVDKKTKDILFIIFNKITIIFEKAYLIDPELFDNKNLGIRYRLYTNNVFYYEYWTISRYLYKTEYIDFIEKKFPYLREDDDTYLK